MLHGEAVAIGILAAGWIEIELGLSTPDQLDRIRAVLERLGVPTRIPANLPHEKLLDLMRHDKKAVDQWPKFVLLDRIGQAQCKDDQYAVQVDREVVEKVLKLMMDD